MATNTAAYEAPAIRIHVEDVSGLPSELEAELAEGRRVELVRGETVIAKLQVSSADATRRPFLERMPDFMARLKEQYGDQIFSDSTALIRADRNGE